MAGPEIDPMTGYKTTGHEWDGIKELTTPIPGWWVTVFLATCFFSVVYMWLYPSIPTMDNVYEGRLGWSSERQLVNDMVAADVEQSHWRSLLASTPLDEVESNEQLRRFAVAGGKAAFNENCAPCHGVGGGGQIGQFPALVDDAWLWGGTVDDIYTTIKYGIRSGNDEARDSLMPTFGDMLSEQEITEVSQYVLALSDPSTDGTRSAMPGAELYEVNCASCHGANGGGTRGGEPNRAPCDGGGASGRGRGRPGGRDGDRRQR